MNVLHIISAKTWGGGESAALSMCKTLKKNGYGVYVLISGNEKMLRPKFETVCGVVCVTLKWTTLWNALELRKFVKKNSINVIHTHTGRMIPFAIIATIGMPVKIVAYRHNVIKNKKDIVHRFIYKRIDALICVSKIVMSYQEMNMYGWLKKKIYVVYNGVEKMNCPYRYEDFSRKDNKKFVVGYAGRIVENKGLIHLVKAFMKIADNNSVLKIAGDDNTEYALKIKKYIRTKKCGQIKWMGYINNMEDFYREIDVMVCPSLVQEAFGLSICEAMYYGKVVIASNNGAQMEIITDNIDGMLVDCGDEVAIEKKLSVLKWNRKLCNEIGKKAHIKIERCFTMDKWMEKMEVIYSKL